MENDRNAANIVVSDQSRFVGCLFHAPHDLQALPANVKHLLVASISY